MIGMDHAGVTAWQFVLFFLALVAVTAVVDFGVQRPANKLARRLLSAGGATTEAGETSRRVECEK